MKEVPEDEVREELAPASGRPWPMSTLTTLAKLVRVRPGIVLVLMLLALAGALAGTLAVMVWDYTVYLKWSSGEFSLKPAAASSPTSTTGR